MISPIRILLVFLRLGCISFGGPIAHLGYFREEFVARRGWLREDEFANVVAIAQTLPGPASSQTGFAVGLLKGGWLGGLAAWTGFTLPSALMMFAFAYAQKDLLRGAMANGILHGLQVVAVAVVAQAVMSMQRRLAADRIRASIAVIAAAVAILCPAPFSTVLAIASGALCSIFLRAKEQAAAASLAVTHTKRGAATALILFCAPFALSCGPPGGRGCSTASIAVARSCLEAVMWCCRCCNRR